MLILIAIIFLKIKQDQLLIWQKQLKDLGKVTMLMNLDPLEHLKLERHLMNLIVWLKN